MQMGLLEPHIEKLRASYRTRAEAMDDALHKHLSGVAEWTRPNGGYFFWLQFAAGTDTGAQREKARELETGFQAGTLFSSRGQLRNCLRLSFAHYNENERHSRRCRQTAAAVLS